MNPIFLKLELEHITNERLERLKHKHLTLIALEEDLLVFRADKKANEYIPDRSK